MHERSIGRRVPEQEGASLFYTNTTSLGRRGAAGAGPGIQYGGTRDVNAAAGYKDKPEYNDFLRAFTRGIARRIVSLFPESTWRNAPIMIDGDSEDGDREGTFAQAFEAVWRSGRLNPTTGETRIGLAYYLPELDKAAMLGRWAVLFLGVADGQEVDEPLEPGSLNDPDDLVYMAVFGERDARVSKWDKEPGSARYGKPLYYTLTTRLPDGGTTELTSVHYTRVIHVSQGGLGNVLEGLSFLEPVYDYLTDLIKVTAGAGEAAYRKSDPGIVVKSRPEYELTGATAELEQIAIGSAQEAIDQQVYDNTVAAVDEYVHKLRRWLMLEGFDVEVLDGEVTDPTGIINAIISLISGTTGIPKRLLLGNEAGDLASTQDQENWAALIESRQEAYAEPMILRAVINRLIWAGALPEPATGDYFALWPSLYSVSPEVEVGVAKTAADALNVLSVEVDPVLFAATYLKSLPAEAIIGTKEPAPIIMPGEVPQDQDQDEDEPTDDEPEGEDDANDEDEGAELAAQTNGHITHEQWISYP